MAERLFMGRGGGGVPPGSTLAQDIRGLANKPPAAPDPATQAVALRALGERFEAIGSPLAGLVNRVAKELEAAGAPAPVATQAPTGGPAELTAAIDRFAGVALSPMTDAVGPSARQPMAQIQATQPAAMEANTQANLDAVYGTPGTGQQIQQLVTRMADQAVQASMREAGNDLTEAMKILQQRIDALKKRRDLIAKSGTGNTQALASIDELLGEMKARLTETENKSVTTEN